MMGSILLVLGGAFGAVGAFQFQKWGVNPVVASCLIGLLGAIIGYFLGNEELTLVVFAGSFVGMTSVSLGTFPMVFFAGLICGVLYILMLPFFDGYGGKLGAIAFVSLTIVLSFIWIGKEWVG